MGEATESDVKVTGHTPGPWSVEGTVAVGAYGVWTEGADPRNPGHDGAGYQVQICSMNPMDRQTPIGKDERGANARLIAASPELLDMLAECADWLERLGDNGESPFSASLADRARQLVTRAKGGAR